MSDIDIFAKTTSCVDIENDVYDILNFEIMKALKEENEELKNKLTKYKMAFEILKDKFHLDILEDDYFGCIYLSYDSVNPDNLPKEEYELLEELMRDGKIN